MEAVRKFYEALSKDEAMRARLNALNEKYQGSQPEAAAVAAELVAFAKAEGFVFTADELAAYVEADVKEISDEQLEAVAGGAYPRECKCIVGGSGTDPVTGHVCVCILGGGGRKDNVGSQLVCIGYGLIS